MAKGNGGNRIGNNTNRGVARLRNRAGGARTLIARARANNVRRVRRRPGAANR